MSTTAAILAIVAAIIPVLVSMYWNKITGKTDDTNADNTTNTNVVDENNTANGQGTVVENTGTTPADDANKW